MVARGHGVALGPAITLATCANKSMNLISSHTVSNVHFLIDSRLAPVWLKSCFFAFSLRP